MSISVGDLEHLKTIVKDHLEKVNVKAAVKDAVTKAISDAEQPVTEEQIMKSIRHEGILDSVMETFNDRVVISQATQQQQSPVDDTEDTAQPGIQYLHLRLIGGRAFLDHINDADALTGAPTPHFTVYLSFRHQRFISLPVPCSCEPAFGQEFLLRLGSHKGASSSEVSRLLGISEPVDIVLVKSDPRGVRTLVSSHHLSWREVLASGSPKKISLEMMGVGCESGIPVGILDMELNLIPRLTSPLSLTVVRTQMNLEKSRRSERERMFLVYARQWWQEFLLIRPQHANRLVKIFAQDEKGVNRFVCSFVSPIRAGRLLETAREAAWWVSLIPCVTLGAGTVGGSQPDQWGSLHAMLASRTGGVFEHSVLLCNLLLGFGLNAYVCIGTKQSGSAHSWVVTVAPDKQVVFWESTSGLRYTLDMKHPYRTLCSVFNHNSFYGNCQPSDHLEDMSMELHDTSRWKPMSQASIESACCTRTSSPLILPPTMDHVLLSNDLEVQLRALVVEHRRSLSLGCKWDEELTHILTPSLVYYETEHKTGVSAGNDEFQQAVIMNTPLGHNFKAFPIRVTHIDPVRAFHKSIQSIVCKDVVTARGDNVRLGVRVRVFVYPEDIVSTWIMYAVKYKSVL